MKIIAIEEAFAMESLQLPKTDGTPISVQRNTLAEWQRRLVDFDELRISDMDAHGVSMQVLSLNTPGIQAAASVEEAVDDARMANDYLAAIVAKHPDRFRGFAALPLQDPDAAVTELRRCVLELGFCGALINDHTNGHYMDEAQFEPVWQALQELDVPLYIHPGAPKADTWNVLKPYPQLAGATWGWGAEIAAHSLRLVYGGIFDRYPKARLIIGHMGEFLPFQRWRLDSRYQTLAEQPLRRKPSEYFGTNIFITTSGVFSSSTLAGAILEMGEDAILFAIDYPYESTEAAVRFLEASALSPTAREKIAFRNAERLLCLR